MPAPDTTKLQVNFKTPNGALINIYAQDAVELSQQLEAVEGLAPQIAALEGVLGATGAVARVAAPPSAQPQPTPPSRPSTGLPGAPPAQSAAPQCNHGARVYREGISKAGKPYKLWSCTSRDRSDQCPAKWVD